jgi:hypothetical protein
MTVLQLRRGNTAGNDAYTGAVGELTIDTEAKSIRLHDGATAGGVSVSLTGAGTRLRLIDTVTGLPVEFQCVDGQFQQV